MSVETVPASYHLQMVTRLEAEVGRLRLENKLLFEHIKGNDADLAMFNRALERALDLSAVASAKAEDKT
jgi:hypothetical protein